ncbi:hypothetical protein IFR05_001384 [Cadophora sp. M221]|nr:hypothetical protein IFR05_001384 [Cadophora sp. M221]
MCQVVPFTLPCCRKVYVEVSKLPSCPNSWPNRKCPPELCIQVRGYEAEDREAGVCWRCKARNTGASRSDRENLRPRIDKATLVLGLDELGVTGRRRREEKNGNCWFCGATAGCNTCGAKEIVAEEDDGKVEATGKRKRDHGGTKGKEVIKKVKVEKRDQKRPVEAFGYPTPSAAPHLQQRYPQVYSHESRAFDQTPQTNSQNYGSNDSPYSRVSQSDVPTYLEAGSMQYPQQANWQAIYTLQEDSLEPTNAFVGQQSQFVNDGGQGNSVFQYHSNEHPPHPEPNRHPDFRHNDGSSSVSAPELWFDRIHQEHDEQAEFKPQYRANEQLSQHNPAIHPDLQQHAEPGFSNIYQQESGPYAQEHPPPDDNDVRNQMSQVAIDESELGFKPENLSPRSAAHPCHDPNIQPGLDDLHMQVGIIPDIFDNWRDEIQFNVTELDDDTLARLLKQYGGGDNSNMDVKSTQGVVNEYGGSNASEQKRL